MNKLAVVVASRLQYGDGDVPAATPGSRMRHLCVVPDFVATIACFQARSRLPEIGRDGLEFLRWYVVDGGGPALGVVLPADRLHDGTFDPERSDQQENRSRRGSNGGRPPVFDKDRYKQRNVGERCFNALKQYRAIATRYNETRESYEAALTIASLLMCI